MSEEEKEEVEHIKESPTYREIMLLRIIDKLQKENAELKKDISNMYDKEVVISIICDNFNVTRLEVLEMLGEDE